MDEFEKIIRYGVTATQLRDELSLFHDRWAPSEDSHVKVQPSLFGIRICKDHSDPDNPVNVIDCPQCIERRRMHIELIQRRQECWDSPRFYSTDTTQGDRRITSLLCRCSKSRIKECRACDQEFFCRKHVDSFLDIRYCFECYQDRVPLGGTELCLLHSNSTTIHGRISCVPCRKMKRELGIIMKKEEREAKKRARRGEDRL